MTTTYQLIARPADGSFEGFVTRDIEGGVCGPFTDTYLYKTLEDLEAFVRVNFNFARIGQWNVSKLGELYAEAENVG